MSAESIDIDAQSEILLKNILRTCEQNTIFGLFLRRSNEDENTLKNYAAFINITRYTDGMKIRKISHENAWT